METEYKSPLDEILPTLYQAAEEWKSKNPPEKIKKDVTTFLNKNREEIVLKLLGFDLRYGSKFALDHCNGRSGNSTAGDFLTSAVATGIDDWLRTVCMPELSEKDRISIQKSMQDEYTARFKRSLLDRVALKATNDAKELADSLFSSKELAGLVRLNTLISS